MSEPAGKRIHRSISKPELGLIKGEGDPARFAEADKVAAELGSSFFKIGRLSSLYVQHIQVFQQILKKVHYKPSELSHYTQWLETDRYEAALLGKKGVSVPDEIIAGISGYQRPEALQELAIRASQTQLLELEAQDDPLAHVINRLEEVRTTEFPELQQDVRGLQKARFAYAIGVASVHGALFAK
jgi:hypothetical protein